MGLALRMRSSLVGSLAYRAQSSTPHMSDNRKFDHHLHKFDPKVDKFSLKFKDSDHMIFGTGGNKAGIKKLNDLCDLLYKLSMLTPVAIVLCCWFVYNREKAHWSHYVRPEYYEWPWLSQRARPYPWHFDNSDGLAKKKSYFFNEYMNSIPGIGYITDAKDVKGSGWLF